MKVCIKSAHFRATAFLVAGHDSQIGTGWFQNKKAEVESEGAVTKQQEKIVPEVKVIESMVLEQALLSGNRMINCIF